MIERHAYAARINSAQHASLLRLPSAWPTHHCPWQFGHRATGSLDLRSRARRKLVRRDSDRPINLALAQDLHGPLEVLDQPGLLHDFGRNFLGLRLRNIPNVEDFIVDRVAVEEADAPLKGHAPRHLILTAFEGAVRPRACARFLSIHSLAGRFAFAGTMSATDTLTFLVRAGSGLQIMQFHDDCSVSYVRARRCDFC